MIAIVQLEFDLIYYYTTVQYISLYTMGSSPEISLY